LRDLTLHLDLEDPTHIHRTARCALSHTYWDKYCIVPALKTPRLTRSSALDIFKTIRRQQQPRAKLSQLTLYAGDSGGRRGGGLRTDAHYEHNKLVKVVCGLSGDGEESCEGMVKADDEFERWEEEHERMYQQVDEMAAKGVWATEGYGGGVDGV